MLEYLSFEDVEFNYSWGVLDGFIDELESILEVICEEEVLR